MSERLERYVPAPALDPLKVPLAPIVQEILRTAVNAGPLPERFKAEMPLSEYHLFICDKDTENQWRTLRLEFVGDNAALPFAEVVRGGIRPDDILGQFGVSNEVNGTFSFGRQGCWVQDGTVESYEDLIKKLTEQQRLIADATQIDWRGKAAPLDALIMSHFWQRFDRDSVNNGPFGGDISQRPPVEYVYPSLGLKSAVYGIYDW